MEVDVIGVVIFTVGLMIAGVATVAVGMASAWIDEIRKK